MTPRPRNATRRTGPPEEEFEGSVTCGSFESQERKPDYPSDAKRLLHSPHVEREFIIQRVFYPKANLARQIWTSTPSSTRWRQSVSKAGVDGHVSGSTLTGSPFRSSSTADVAFAWKSLSRRSSPTC